MNIFVCLRIILGIFFVISGSQKLIEPYQNFLYVVQSYELLSTPFEELVARTIPWIEFLLGVFLILGLWLRNVLAAFMVLTSTFMFVVGQALVRHLPITECGCFGDLISFPLPVVLTLDSSLLCLFAVLLKRLNKVSSFSLDNYFR